MSGEINEEFVAQAAEPEPAIAPAETYVVEAPRPMRFPNIADVGLLSILLVFAALIATIITAGSLQFHLLGVSTAKQAFADIRYALGWQLLWYLFTLMGCIALFPHLWHTPFFRGMEWRWSAAADARGRLMGTAFFCLVLAVVDGKLMPGPENAPIDEVFKMPGAPWFMFFFGTLLAPFFEEMLFRGFLLPAFCTAYDWSVERITKRPAPWPDEQGKTVWTLPAMAVGSVLVSIPFALMHGAQTGYSLGPFVLLFCVSLVLCWVRLRFRSLAASTLVHASYNLLLFAIMIAGTGGFKNLDRL
ncbi:CPBP family intramembrane glutamic endopeptidase [Terracidiphilus gabretensis]|uniref:CPBP family intramembrane glutamic endopeptidase n=1 Tax=Terracidiphilus gabretensis TaxID=1577687 RepID=UPI00071C0E1A|nr:CPBP family intramembrane glutamic endopeptidase [Terracidiphilus gabretensis]